MGELLQRKPLFKGKSTKEQLELIVRKLGTPTEAQCAFIEHPGPKRLLAKIGEIPTPDYRRMFPDASAEAADCVQ